MPKFDLKKKINEAGKKAEKSLQKGVKAAKEFDIKDAAKTTGKFVENVADNVKNYDMKNMPDDLKNMAETTADKATRFVKDVNQNSKDIKKALKDLKEKDQDTEVSVYEACYVYYLLMNIDGVVSREEIENFEAIATDSKLSDEDKTKLLKKCKKIVKDSKGDDDYYDIINEEAINILKEHTKSDQNITKNGFIWNLITLANCDKDYSKVEKKFIKSMARILGVDKEIVREMEFYYSVLKGLMLEHVTNVYYKHELEGRKENINNAIQLLIKDKEA